MSERFVPKSEIDDMQDRFVKLMGVIGDQSTCKSCGATIWWVKTKRGRNMPISEAMVSHFADCPYADQHRGR